MPRPANDLDFPMSNEVLDAQLQQLKTDAGNYRDAGCELAQAALHVIQNYDGLHRLSLAVAKWAKTVANEGGREKLHATDKEPLPQTPPPELMAGANVDYGFRAPPQRM